ncbi:MAG: copper chaperone PCu(A)C, partial [Pseudomonadota bacterium]
MRLLSFVLLLAALPAFADDGESIHAGHGWLAETRDDTARLFISLENQGDAMLILTDISSDLGMARLMGSPIKAGTPAQPIPVLPLSPGAELRMEPDGVYILLSNLSAPLLEGSEIELTAQIDPIGKVELHFEVEGP